MKFLSYFSIQALVLISVISLANAQENKESKGKIDKRCLIFNGFTGLSVPGNDLVKDYGTFGEIGGGVMFQSKSKWLFGLEASQIEVIVHPQSIIHSMVQFEDGSIKAQMGLPDMRLPIQFALTYPHRIKANFPRFDFTQYPALTFEQPDLKTFRNLQFAFDAMEQGGNMACIVNAANEIAVAAFLRDEIGFLEMSDLIETCMQRVTFIQQPTLNDYIETDAETRKVAEQFVIST